MGVVSFGLRGSGGNNHEHPNLSLLNSITAQNGVLYLNSSALLPPQVSGLLHWTEARFLLGHNESQRVPHLLNQSGGIVSTQPNVNEQAIYRGNIAGGKPGLEFLGGQYYPFDFTSLAGNYYTFSFVEARKVGQTNYLLGNQGGSTNTGLHIGYVSSNQARFAHFANDLDANVETYSQPLNRVWVFSYNFRGFEIWLNRVRIGSRPNTQGLISSTGGNFGRGHSWSCYIGIFPGFAVHFCRRTE